jgi:hypothetical protein
MNETFHLSHESRLHFYKYIPNNKPPSDIHVIGAKRLSQAAQLTASASAPY